MHYCMIRDIASFNWNHVRAFLATVEEGSLSAAARALKISQPTLGRQVSALEHAIGVPLFERVGTTLTLTEEGRSLAEHAREFGRAASQFALAASGRSQAIEGIVRVSVGELFAAFVMPPIIERLREHHPGIVIELVASNISSDLKRREADIAFRADPGSQPNLKSIEVNRLASRFYASSDYLERHSKIRAAGHQIIDFDDSGAYLHFLGGLGLAVSDEDITVRAESHYVQWALAKRGLGIVTALEIIGDADPDMRRVWPEMDPIVSSMHLVSHRDLLGSPRIATIFDFLREELSALGS